jgi:hypothetical protein
MKLTAKYDPIPKTIFIDEGTLHVGSKEVNWQKVKGRVGLQEIINTSGDLSWQTGDALLHIKEIQGQLDGESLYKMLEQTGVMQEKKVQSKLSSLSGKIDVSHGLLEGPADQPEEWEYKKSIGSTQHQRDKHSSG